LSDYLHRFYQRLQSLQYSFAGMEDQKFLNQVAATTSRQNDADRMFKIAAIDRFKANVSFGCLTRRVAPTKIASTVV